MTTRIYLVRHGESEWNRSSRYAGQRDVPLSALGQEQARRLARRLEGEGLAALYASPLARARETAAIIGQALHKPVTIEPRLAEIDHGLWEGLTTRQVNEAFPTDYGRWRSHPQTVIMPQGESLADVARRAETALNVILADHRDDAVLICSHDAVLRVLLLKCLGLTLDHFWKWSIENASLSILEAYGDGHAQTFRLARLNDTAHLEGVYSAPALQAL